jgi:hypothetical protein
MQSHMIGMQTTLDRILAAVSGGPQPSLTYQSVLPQGHVAQPSPGVEFGQRPPSPQTQFPPLSGFAVPVRQNPPCYPRSICFTPTAQIYHIWHRPKHRAIGWRKRFRGCSSRIRAYRPDRSPPRSRKCRCGSCQCARTLAQVCRCLRHRGFQIALTIVGWARGRLNQCQTIHFFTSSRKWVWNPPIPRFIH